MNKRKVLLAFSGGVDSCTAARILQEQGYEVSLLTLNLFGDEPITRAVETAKNLGLPLKVKRLADQFHKRIPQGRDSGSMYSVQHTYQMAHVV